MLNRAMALVKKNSVKEKDRIGQSSISADSPGVDRERWDDGGWSSRRGRMAVHRQLERLAPDPAWIIVVFDPAFRNPTRTRVP